jgi:hypothetical protein
LTASTRNLHTNFARTTETTPRATSTLLCGEGLLTRRREGTRVLYSLIDYTACRIIVQVAQSATARVEELGERILKAA